MFGIPRPITTPIERPAYRTPAQLMAANVEAAWNARKSRKPCPHGLTGCWCQLPDHPLPVAKVFTASGCQPVELTAEEAAYAAERSLTALVGWDAVEGWTVAELPEREA